jgi:Zn-dependent protease with chaperone function
MLFDKNPSNDEKKPDCRRGAPRTTICPAGSAMTDDQFDHLVARIEAAARRHPTLYQCKVLLLAALGNAYLGAVLLLVAALLAALAASLALLKALALKLILIVGFFLWRVLKALWVHVEPPTGTEIKPAQAPELFALIEDIRRRLGAPRFHQVLIDADINAGVVQWPRLGILGWYRNYLVIGLPLMKSLSVEQFKAVLAHEFGHLAKGHGRMSNWVYRQRLRWSRLLHMLEAQGSRGDFLFRPFFYRFAPYFNAYSFPLARANEYEADATSVRLTSPRAVAEALTSVNVVGRYLDERYWPQIHRQADEQAQPAFAPYFGMGQRMSADLDEATARQWLDRAMERQTTSSDTHPALKERLAAIGETARLAPPAPGQAADRLCGAALRALTESFDRRWQEAVLPAWQERHRKVQEERRQLADLNARHAGGAELTLQEAFDRATLTESAEGNADAALEQFRALHQRAPDDPVVCLSLGQRLLARDDDSGCAQVERAMQIDQDFTLRACELLRDYHWRNGRKEQAHAWHQRLVERAQLQQAAEKERGEVLLKDQFERHDLSPEALAEVLAQLRTVGGLRRVYLVKKRVRHFADRSCHVLGYSATGWWQWHRKQRAGQAMQRIKAAIRFPGEALIVCVDGENYRFGRKFRWMRGARIF